MSNDDISRATLEELNVAVRYKRMSEELLQHLIGSIRYFQWYSKHYNIPLPNEDVILRSAERAEFLIDQMTQPTNRDLTGEKNNRKLNSSLVQ